MIRVHVFVEGQTEEAFARELLFDHFQPLNIYLNPILIRTGKTGKGGLTSYGKIKKQINRKCMGDSTSYVTTMFDYYGLPDDFPGKSDPLQFSDSVARAIHVEKSFEADIGLRNFIGNLQIHEFEGVLFSKPEAFHEWFDPAIIPLLKRECSGFTTPEHINDEPGNAPSKRISRHCPGYQKITHGSLIALDIGLDAIRSECPHFNDWLHRLEGLTTPPLTINEEDRST